MDWNADEKAMLDQVARFADEVLAPRAAELDENATFATCHLPALAELGLLGLNLPEAHGGMGLSGPMLYKAVELVAGACASTASMLTAHYLATDSLHLGADAALKARMLPRAANGALGAFALTEPEAGSNPADMRTTARREGDGYRLRGSKCFISNAGAADFIVVYAKTDPDAGARGVSAFVVEPAVTPGITVSPAERTMGLRGGHVFGVTIDCHVPEANRIGAEGTGFRTAMKVLDNGRIEVAAQATGIAAAALDSAIAYAKERRVSGHPIADFQGLQWMLADSANDLAAARALGYAAARLRGTDKRYSSESAHAKLFASEAAWRIADRALQIHGGYGYCRDFPLERHLRDLRIFRIYEGSSEIQRTIIARELLS
ncbi:acyl-CoA dehydrogenase family protein [Lutimaribacter sp. EGI FJ00015]|uniref:Acyl-CoA dehydrogenase family protein n=1 Tax=Lutimaribacter degradans TaxID=2945989 RepID=A0ACC5ZV71_9RHOB|nr:acyl-CoA dehydrogenase family protein [Lutimaribacter sp. EGI FJ00013]MCM2562078.1 acyl-CoA dehydrogenase family protein [Lutimaribacter sp. EGI FJ00013]MCO0613231.1 acyl-CoA dehydrogenase family protein [Lutimaribacter sp. EGI FJ00015]MCO0636208.1 acyl-CoA dehydrogenase family protein [Lutimaribacter sp. EGI FJ00014]